MWTTREDIGKAEMPAAPTMGLIFFLRKRLRNLTKNTPPMVSKQKATRPRARMTMVLILRNFDHTITGATDRPSSSEMRLASTFCAVSESESSTRHSRRRLPNIRKPTSATLLGAAMPAMKVTKMGKRMRVVREMLAGLYSIFIMRSFLVVTRRMQGGCTMGTSAM